jgi:hypothetical protein
VYTSPFEAVKLDGVASPGGGLGVERHLRPRPRAVIRRHERALAGLLVADITQNVAGPYCPILGDMGAQVIRSAPRRGDDARAGPAYWGESATFAGVGAANGSGRRPQGPEGGLSSAAHRE